MVCFGATGVELCGRGGTGAVRCGGGARRALACMESSALHSKASLRRLRAFLCYLRASFWLAWPAGLARRCDRDHFFLVLAEHGGGDGGKSRADGVGGGDGDLRASGGLSGGGSGDDGVDSDGDSDSADYDDSEGVGNSGVDDNYSMCARGHDDLRVIEVLVIIIVMMLVT
eukprot:4858488-Pleurochrysis_carterae.AAC.1